MKKSEKRMILLLIIVAIVIIAVLVNMKGKNDETNPNPNVSNEGNAGVNENAGGNGEVAEPPVVEEFVQTLDEGVKLNISDKLSETKTFSNYEISNIQLTEQGGLSTILADVKNVGATKSEMVLIDITLVDKEGNEIVTIGGVVGEVEPGQTTQLNAGVTTDCANAYDFTVKISDQQQ